MGKFKGLFRRDGYDGRNGALLAAIRVHNGDPPRRRQAARDDFHGFCGGSNNLRFSRILVLLNCTQAHWRGKGRIAFLSRYVNARAGHIYTLIGSR